VYLIASAEMKFKLALLLESAHAFGNATKGIVRMENVCVTLAGEVEIVVQE
jgi:hypothetical protein